MTAAHPREDIRINRMLVAWFQLRSILVLPYESY
ncbi:hypothetical protein BH24CHL3_BH24CHL3_04740 [soil metagenome]